jgi:hypothetical protein
MTDESLRREAVRFFEWCRFNLHSVIDDLDVETRRDVDTGKLPSGFSCAVEKAWLKNLNTSLSWAEHFQAVREALPRQEDYNRYMNCLMSQLENLPDRILRAVAKEERQKSKENHAAFFGHGGAKWLEMHLRVWQSQRHALTRLIVEAWGYKQKPNGGAGMGAVEIDIESMMLSQVEATGSAMNVRGLLHFVKSLWEKEKTIAIGFADSKSNLTAHNNTTEFERRVIPNPERSEPRLNRFLIKLGRALAATSKRAQLPNWQHIDQTMRFIVHGWCENITVDDEPWPMLCFLTTPALAKFLSLCTPRRWSENQDPRTLERKIIRLGLLRPPKGRVRHVEKKSGQFRFF